MTSSVTVDGMVHVFLKSGGIVELLFAKRSDASRVASELRPQGGEGPIQAMDDFGHVLSTRREAIEGVNLADLDAEIRGQAAVMFARQMMQDRLSERVHKAREMMSPGPVSRQNGNGGIRSQLLQGV
jgi:hypothetical protein